MNPLCSCLTKSAWFFIPVLLFCNLSFSNENPILRPLSTDCSVIYAQVETEDSVRTPLADKMLEKDDIRGEYAAKLKLIEDNRSSNTDPELVSKLEQEAEAILKELQDGAAAIGIENPKFDKSGFLISGRFPKNYAENRELLEKLFASNPNLQLVVDGLFETPFLPTTFQMNGDKVEVGTMFTMTVEKNEGNLSLELTRKTEPPRQSLPRPVPPPQLDSSPPLVGSVIPGWGHSSPNLVSAGLRALGQGQTRNIVTLRNAETKELLGVGFVTGDGLKVTIPLLKEPLPEKLEIRPGSKTSSSGSDPAP